MIRPSGTALGLLGASVAAFGLVVGFLVVPVLRSADERAPSCRKAVRSRSRTGTGASPAPTPAAGSPI